MADRIELGSVVGVFGFRGELRLHLHNRENSVLGAAREVYLRGPDGAERVATVSVRPGAGKRIIAKVEGVDDFDSASALVGATVLVDRDSLPPVPDGEFYVADLVGLTVEDPEGTVLGTLRDVVHGERDVWVVDTDHGEAFLVASGDNVLEVDHERGVIVVASGALSAD